MPRDTQLLPPMSQALLRAARSGEITKKAPPQPLLEDDKENGEDDDATGDADQGFIAKRWAAVPRHLEAAEPEFLAKRRKGLPSAYTGPLGQISGAAPMRKTKVKKLDASGVATVLDVLVPEGQTVDGEVVEGEAKATQAPAPGTVVEGVGVANAEGVIVAGDQLLPTPPRRRPPPPKRKAKGPGRGRKKKVAFATGLEGQNIPNSDAAAMNGSNGVNGLAEGQNGDAMADGDVVMEYDNPLQHGEESSEEDDEGEEGDDGDREEGELSPSSPSPKSPSKPPLTPDRPSAWPSQQENHAANETVHISPHQNHTDTPQSPMGRDASSSPELPLTNDQEIAALSGVSKPLDDRISAPPNGETLISVEEPPGSIEKSPDEALNASVIPQDHDPLEGLAEPKIVDVDDHQQEQETQLSDGEIDLLGSLEKQLNGNDITASNAT